MKTLTSTLFLRLKFIKNTTPFQTYMVDFDEIISQYPREPAAKDNGFLFNNPPNNNLKSENDFP